MSTTAPQVATPVSQKNNLAVTLNRIVYTLGRHWILTLSTLLGVYVGLPWLAPVFMNVGWTDAGRTIYTVYATQCHQLPERSFFLFGPKAMYSLEEIQTVWQKTDNPNILRQFVGNSQLGWKVGWSDRMVSLYTSIFFGLLLYGLINKRLKPLPLLAFVLFVLPLALDGGTHLLSDVMSLGRIGAGFRDSNIWLAILTNNILPTWFYSGDALGSFNSWMRLLTGLVFGIGIVWLVAPLIADACADTMVSIERKFSNFGNHL